MKVRAAFLALLLFTAIGFRVPTAAAEPEPQEPKSFPWNLRNTSDPESGAGQRRLLSLPAPLQGVIPGRNVEKVVPESDEMNNALPGLGTLKAPKNTASLGDEFLGGSLELTTPFQKTVPAIYVEGEGYLPLTHPALEPYLDPEILAHPERDPSVVMVPEGYLSGRTTAIPANLPETSRTINVSGNSVLSLPPKNHYEPIVVSANSGWKRQTEKHEIYFLEGDCSIRQANSSAQGPKAVIWVDRQKSADQTHEITVYLESEESHGPIYVESSPGMPEAVETRVFDQKWFGRFSTLSTIEVAIMQPGPALEQDPAIFQRALDALTPELGVLKEEQFSKTSTTIVSTTTSPRYRRITLIPRRDNDMDIAFDPYPTDPTRGVVVIAKGLNVIIDGVQDEMLLGNTIDISADNAVIWMSNPSRLANNRETTEDSNRDFELYLEGNIIFLDKSRRIEAHRMYYDAKNNLAYILEGRLDTPILGIKGITGNLRVKAEILQQLGEGVFSAKNSLVTTSQLGQPSYSLRSRTMTMTEKTVAPIFGQGDPVRQQILVAENNYLAAQNVPIFYWPWMAADLKDPTFYIKSISYGNSTLYGNKISTVWNPFQLLNIRNRPSWLDGDLGITWLEKRGLAHSVNVDYSPSGFFGVPGSTRGFIRYRGISDSGTDRLGGKRKNVEFPHKYRYDFLWNHRQKLDSVCTIRGDWSFTGQLGKLSDRNFINSYRHNEWNQSDNPVTMLELQKHNGDSTISLSAEYALDDCFTNPNWLPRLDHYVLGRSLLRDRLTWYEHTRVGYMDYNTATEPYDWMHDGKYFSYLPWELATGNSNGAIPNPDKPQWDSPRTINSSCEVFSTRHEIDLPFNVGPLRCVPYVLGDFSHWGTDRDGKDAQRFYGQGGVRLNLPFWKVLPRTGSRTWYLNGLAHKVDFDAELSYARADHNMENLLMTDSMDTWAVEDARRRHSSMLFGGIIPTMFDPRYYALRSGTAGNVTAGNMEIADDLTLCRFGMTHRWQTKRGPVGNRHIIDWITLSTHFNYYPESEHNYGKSIGLIDYNFLWHVGDRFSLFSSGLYDLFEDGQRVTRIGGVWNRPKRGNLSVVYDQLEGLVQRNYLTLSVGYDMNEKYSIMYTTSFRVQTDRWENAGHGLMFTRTGESFRVLIGATYNEARDDWGFSFGIEPVFMRGIAKKMSSMSKNIQNSR